METNVTVKTFLLIAICAFTVAAGCGATGAREDSEMKIRIKIGDAEVTATMLDTEASRDFMAMLPLTLQLTDYAGTEKVCDLPRRLSTQNAPSGYDPSVGDITYYAPWGNLAIFYKDFGYAKGLVPLGAIDSGLEKLAALSGDTTVTIERMGEQP